MGDSGVVTIARGDASRLVEQRRFVARDRHSFQAVWAAHAGPDAPMPTIDFNARMVAAVFAGERPTPGYEILITGTRREGSTLVIVDEERVPPADRIAAQVIVSPFHIVSLPRHDGSIRFNTPDGPLQTTIVFKPPKRESSEPEPTIAPDATASVEETTRVMPAQAPARASWQASDDASSTGLTPQMAAALAYLAGPFSGLLLLATERSNQFVRFHAWQAVVGLGLLGTAAVCFLALAFVFLIVSPTGFWIMLWIAAAAGAAWLVAWGVCLFQAYHGRRWKLPLFGEYAERRATSLRAS
jgi:uncharacterized membrane protein